MNELVTLGPMAMKVGVLEAQLRALCNRGKVPHGRVGQFRTFDVADLPAIRQACIEAGYLKPETVGVSNAAA